MNPLENLAIRYYQLFEQLGINPIYLFVCSIILLILQRNKFKNWKDLKRREKSFLILTIFCFVVFGIAALVYILIIT